MRMGRSPGFLFLNTLCAPEQNKTSFPFQFERQWMSQTALLSLYSSVFHTFFLFFLSPVLSVHLSYSLYFFACSPFFSHFHLLFSSSPPIPQLIRTSASSSLLPSYLPFVFLYSFFFHVLFILLFLLSFLNLLILFPIFLHLYDSLISSIFPCVLFCHLRARKMLCVHGREGEVITRILFYQKCFVHATFDAKSKLCGTQDDLWKKNFPLHRIKCCWIF